MSQAPSHTPEKNEYSSDTLQVLGGFDIPEHIIAQLEMNVPESEVHKLLLTRNATQDKIIHLLGYHKRGTQAPLSASINRMRGKKRPPIRRHGRQS